MALPNREVYAQKITGLVNSLGRLEKKSVRAATRILKDLRRSIVRDLKSARGFRADFLPELELAVENSLTEFKSRYTTVAQTGNTEAWKIGQQAAKLPVQSALGIDLSIPELPPDLLETLQGTTADLVTDVSDRMRGSINQEVRLAATGFKRPNEAIQEITKMFRTNPRSIGARKGRTDFAFQAERIIRTETNRVFSAANFGTMQQTKDAVKDIKKQWVTTLDGRERHGEKRGSFKNANHRKLDGEIQSMNELFSNGLMFPLDPRGEPKEVVNCRCRMIVHRDDWEKAP